MNEQIQIKSYSKKGDHFVLYNLLSGEREVSSLLGHVKYEYLQFCELNDISPIDTVYCKIQAKDDLLYDKIKNIFSSLIEEDKIAYTFQTPLLVECSIIFYTISNNYYDDYGLEFCFKSFQSQEESIALETHNNFSNLQAFMAEHNLNVFDNVIRTWIYIDDIDNNYADFVTERGIFFDKNGMNSQTRYLASTGIGMGTQESFDGKYKSQVDVLLISGTNNENIESMTNYTIMPDPIDYGVHFERGLSLEMNNKKHLYISGTASIDGKGNVLHVGDIEKQTIETIKNVKLLLKNNDSELKDLSHLIVYLRNAENIEIVQKIINESFPNDIPIQFSKGPVCRPTWLIELEGMVVI